MKITAEKVDTKFAIEIIVIKKVVLKAVIVKKDNI